MTDVTTIPCGDILSIADVGDLYANLLMSMAEGSTINIDASEIEKIDAASLQMIYAFSKEAEKQGKPLTWDSASSAFLHSAKLLGLAELMNLEDNTA